jgi:drug/metabolite transporter (DMT)-like permease
MSEPTVSPLSRWAATATILLTLLGWSSIPLFLKYFSKDIDAWTANGWRYSFSAILWLPVLLVGWKRGTLPQNLWRAALVPSIFNAMGQLLFGLAPYFIDPGLMTFGLRLQIVFVGVGAALLFPAERALLKHPAFLGGLIVVFAATLFTIASKPGPEGSAANALFTIDLTDRRTLIGVLCAIGSGFFYAAYALSVRKWMVRMPAFTAFAAVSQYSALILLVPMLIFAKDHAGVRDFGMSALDLSGSKFLLLILSSVIGIGLGHTMYFFSLARLGLAVSSGVVQLQPIVVSLASIVLFKEVFTTNQWIGGTIAVSAAIWMLAVQHRFASRARANVVVK